MDQQDAQQQLTWMQERGFETAYDSGKRKLWLACVLAAALGVAGGHRFYLGMRRSAILMSAITLAGFVLALLNAMFLRNTATGVIGELFAGLLIIAVGAWAVVDLFRIPSMVREFNDRLSAEIKLKLRAGFFV